ncbi:MAG: hypothetical protein AAFX06_03235 [Planctomycetota bacterium]
MITLIAAYLACLLLLIFVLVRAPSREDLPEITYESELAESLSSHADQSRRLMADAEAWREVDPAEPDVRSPTLSFEKNPAPRTPDRNAG